MIKGLLSRLVGQANDPQTQVEPPKDSSKFMILKAMYPINRDTAAVAFSILSHEGTIKNDFPALQQLLSMSTDYMRAKDKNGTEYQYHDENRRYSGFYKPTAQNPEDTAIIIEEERFSDNTWRLTSVMSVDARAMFMMIVVMPCCDDENSVLSYFKPVDAKEWSWNLNQSPKALIAGVLDDYKNRQVQIGSVREEADRMIIHHRLKHLLGQDHECSSGVGFGSGYRDNKPA